MAAGDMAATVRCHREALAGAVRQGQTSPGFGNRFPRDPMSRCRTVCRFWDTACSAKARLASRQRWPSRRTPARSAVPRAPGLRDGVRSESDLSLAISANIVRVLDEKGVPVRDLPRLSGVSKEAIGVALGFLGKRGFAVMESVSRTKLARLTPKGREAQNAIPHRLAAIEQRWESRYRQADGARWSHLRGKALLQAIEPHPGNWRASVPKPETLPHFPMVLHRGGFPDGS